MRALLAVAATIALSGCSIFGGPEDARPPADTPPPVDTGPHPTVTMKYKGPSGYDIAARKATEYCGKHYAGTSARLLADDLKGKARFECVK